VHFLRVFDSWAFYYFFLFFLLEKNGLKIGENGNLGAGLLQWVVFMSFGT
jgi:hypothetical protein